MSKFTIKEVTKSPSRPSCQNAKEIKVGTLFRAKLSYSGGCSSVFLAAYESVVDLLQPINTYGPGTTFSDIEELDGELTFWKV